MKSPIYFDYAATTPVDPRVAQKMSECLLAEGKFGNPASRSHKFGWEAEEAVEIARRHMADLLNCDPREIVWTSGATESDNLAIKGVAQFYKSKGKHIITSKIEHKAVLDTCRHLEREGFEVTYLEPDTNGIISPESVAAAIREDTTIVSIMHVNNEIGVVNDIAAIGEVTRAAKVFFHVDAAQSAGKVNIDLGELKVDLMSFSAHKIYGPKGVGALFVRRKPRVRLEAERLWDGFNGMEEVYVSGHIDHHIPGIINISFNFVEGESLIMSLPDIALSSGSACTSASLEPSYVLRALGLNDELAHSSLRFSIGRFTTEEDVDQAIGSVRAAVEKLRELSPLWDMYKDGVDMDKIEWAAH